jgi:2-(1,2-epoxy-1,2-dihydrophenyl)acetyl-CoA isomerase
MSATGQEAEVLLERADGVAIVTLNRPDRLNALATTTMRLLAEIIAEVAEDPAVGCVVVTGSGRGFCAGGDIKEERPPVAVDPARGGRVEQSFTRLRGFFETSRLLHEMPKPTIAMVNGPVAGAGIGIAGACDLRFAASSATFMSAFGRIGASGDFGATWFWTKILGSGAARELFFLEEKLSAEEALRRGIYTRVYPDDELRGVTLAAAKKLAAGPRIGWRYMKANLNLAEDAAFEAALDQEALYMGLSTSATASIHKARRTAEESNQPGSDR